MKWIDRVLDLGIGTHVNDWIIGGLVSLIVRTMGAYLGTPAALTGICALGLGLTAIVAYRRSA